MNGSDCTVGLFLEMPQKILEQALLNISMGNKWRKIGVSDVLLEKYE